MTLYLLNIPSCFHGLKSPRLLAFGFASFRRFLSVLSCWTCLTMFNLLTLTLSSSSLQGIVCKHPLLLSRSLVRHSSSKLVSALAQSQISASHCEPLLNPFPPVRSWIKFRMTLGDSCYLYSHFLEANSILMSDSLLLFGITLKRYSFIFAYICKI